MDTSVSRTKLRSLGIRLRRLREDADLNLQQVADLAGVSRATLSRVERAQTLPKEHVLLRVLTVLGVKGAEADELLQFNEGAHRPNWLATDTSEQLITLIDYEQATTLITSVTQTVVPGLLQTEDYARAVFTAGVVPQGDLDNRIAARLGRQEILDRGTQLVAVLSEAALMHSIGGPAVALDQFRHLMAIASRPNVSIHVVPRDRDELATMNCGFVLLQFPDQPPVAYVEHPLGGTFVDQGDAVERLGFRATKLRASAASPIESVELIRQAVTRLERLESR